MKREFLAHALGLSCLMLVAAPAGRRWRTRRTDLSGDPAAATDYYQVSTCSDDGSGVPASLVAQVQNRGPNAASAGWVGVVVHGASPPRPQRIQAAVTWP